MSAIPAAQDAQAEVDRLSAIARGVLLAAADEADHFSPATTAPSTVAAWLRDRADNLPTPAAIDMAAQRDVAYDDIRWLLRQRGEPAHRSHDVPPVDEGRGRGCLTCLRYAQIIERLPVQL